MYEVFKRVSGYEKQFAEDDENYQEGYKDGYNDAIEEVERMADELSWEVEKAEKNLNVYVIRGLFYDIGLFIYSKITNLWNV